MRAAERGEPDITITEAIESQTSSDVAAGLRLPPQAHARAHLHLCPPDAS